MATSYYLRELFTDLNGPLPYHYYNTGTVQIADGASESLVTLTGGSFPEWVNDGAWLTVSGVIYEVKSRTDATHIKIYRDNVIVPAGASYNISTAILCTLTTRTSDSYGILTFPNTVYQTPGSGRANLYWDSQSSPYSLGSITVTPDAGGAIVALASGSFPAWVDVPAGSVGAYLWIRGTKYDVLSRASATSIRLVSTTASFPLGTPYVADTPPGMRMRVFPVADSTTVYEIGTAGGTGFGSKLPMLYSTSGVPVYLFRQLSAWQNIGVRRLASHAGWWSDRTYNEASTYSGGFAAVSSRAMQIFLAPASNRLAGTATKIFIRNTDAALAVDSKDIVAGMFMLLRLSAPAASCYLDFEFVLAAANADGQTSVCSWRFGEYTAHAFLAQVATGTPPSRTVLWEPAGSTILSVPFWSDYQGSTYAGHLLTNLMLFVRALRDDPAHPGDGKYKQALIEAYIQSPQLGGSFCQPESARWWNVWSGWVYVGNFATGAAGQASFRVVPDLNPNYWMKIREMAFGVADLNGEDDPKSKSGTLHFVYRNAKNDGTFVQGNVYGGMVQQVASPARRVALIEAGGVESVPFPEQRVELFYTDSPYTLWTRWLDGSSNPFGPSNGPGVGGVNHWSPVLAVSGNTLVAAMVREEAPAATLPTWSDVEVTVSTDGGTTWSARLNHANGTGIASDAGYYTDAVVAASRLGYNCMRLGTRWVFTRNCAYSVGGVQWNPGRLEIFWSDADVPDAPEDWNRAYWTIGAGAQFLEEPVIAENSSGGLLVTWRTSYLSDNVHVDQTYGIRYANFAKTETGFTWDGHDGVADHAAGATTACDGLSGRPWLPSTHQPHSGLAERVGGRNLIVRGPKEAIHSRGIATVFWTSDDGATWHRHDKLSPLWAGTGQDTFPEHAQMSKYGTRGFLALLTSRMYAYVLADDSGFAEEVAGVIVVDD